MSIPERVALREEEEPLLRGRELEGEERSLQRISMEGMRDTGRE